MTQEEFEEKRNSLVCRLASLVGRSYLEAEYLQTRNEFDELVDEAKKLELDPKKGFQEFLASQQ